MCVCACECVRVCVYMCVCACARARMCARGRACARVRVSGGVRGRECADSRKGIRGRAEGCSCTYLALGRNAASMMAPEAPRCLPLKFVSFIEASIVTGGASL